MRRLSHVIRSFITCAALSLSAVALAPTTAIAQPGEAAPAIVGNWVNPHGTVAVTARPCEEKLCGWVSWAATEAQNDAKEAGVPRLVGVQLLQDYRPTGAGRWTGRVFVPDMGKTYYSTIEQIGPDQLKISGCILGGLLCKSQIWRRG